MNNWVYFVNNLEQNNQNSYKNINKSSSKNKSYKVNSVIKSPSPKTILIFEVSNIQFYTNNTEQEYTSLKTFIFTNLHAHKTTTLMKKLSLIVKLICKHISLMTIHGILPKVLKKSR